MINILSRLFLNKDAVYIAVIIAMIGSAWYILDDWHYKPLRVQESTILMLGNQLNVCVGVRDTCEAQLLKQSVEDYQNGLGDNNEDSAIDFDNLTS